MDDIKLEQATILKKNITQAKENLNAWQTSTGFTHSARIPIYFEDYPGHQTNAPAPVTPETFIVVKALNVTHWQGVVAQLEKEYEQL